MKDIYHRVAVNMLRWTPDVRLAIMDRLRSPYERECVRQEFEKIMRKDEEFTALPSEIIEDREIYLKEKNV